MHVITVDDSQGIILWVETESTLLVIKPTIHIGLNYVLFEISEDTNYLPLPIARFIIL